MFLINNILYETDDKLQQEHSLFGGDITIIKINFIIISTNQLNKLAIWNWYNM